MGIWDIAKWLKSISGTIWDMSLRYDLRFAYQWQGECHSRSGEQVDAHLPFLSMNPQLVKPFDCTASLIPDTLWPFQQQSITNWCQIIQISDRGTKVWTQCCELVKYHSPKAESSPQAIYCFTSMWWMAGGSLAKWLACWTKAKKDPSSNCSRDAVG